MNNIVIHYLTSQLVACYWSGLQNISGAEAGILGYFESFA